MAQVGRGNQRDGGSGAIEIHDSCHDYGFLQLTVMWLLNATPIINNGTSLIRWSWGRSSSPFRLITNTRTWVPQKGTDPILNQASSGPRWRFEGRTPMSLPSGIGAALPGPCHTTVRSSSTKVPPLYLGSVDWGGGWGPWVSWWEVLDVLDSASGFWGLDLRSHWISGGLEHFFPYGMSSSQMTNSIIFQRGRAQPPTRFVRVPPLFGFQKPRWLCHPVQVDRPWALTPWEDIAPTPRRTICRVPLLLLGWIRASDVVNSVK